MLERIREFISCTNVLILFVFKRDNTFRLYINYQKLNSIIIKNRYLLSLIKKTLDQLISAYYFIKLDFKNAYYRIYTKERQIKDCISHTL